MISKTQVAISLCMLVCLSSLLGCQPKVDTISNIIRDRNDLETMPNALSPDGDWLVRILLRENQSFIEFFPIEKPSKKISILADSGVGTYRQVSAWSPDNTMVAIVEADTRGKCAYNTVAVYKLNESFQIESFVFRLPQKDSGCLAVAWSPNSSYLAIYNGSEDIVYIIDKQANLTTSLNLQSNNVNIYVPNIMWKETGLYITVFNYKEDYGGLIKAELRRYLPLGNVKFTPVYESKSSFEVLGYGPGVKEVALVEMEDYDSNTGSDLLNIDLSTRQITRKLHLNFTPSDASSSSDGNFIGMVNNVKQGTQQLFFYNWKEANITNYGSITYLIGWRATIDGFLVVQGEEGQYVISVIQPR